MFFQKMFHSFFFFFFFFCNAPIDRQQKLMIQYESAAVEYGRMAESTACRPERWLRGGRSGSLENVCGLEMLLECLFRPS